jgi:hypothetical protein
MGSASTRPSGIAREAGAVAYLTKAHVFEHLIETIAAVQRGENFVAVLD